MKALKTTYWTTTIIISFMMAYSAYAYLTKEEMTLGFQHLGFPGYFRIELAVAKLIGVLLLLAPIAGRIKEWVYAGFSFVFVSAFIAHAASGDPIAMRIAPIIFLLLLAISYITYHMKVSQAASINFIKAS